MAEPITPTDTTPATDAAKGHFAKAVEEAKAGAKILGEEAKGRAGQYKEEYKGKFDEKKADWTEKGKTRSGEAKVKAHAYAVEGKAKTSKAMSDVARLVEDNASTIDEKIGVKYGDYARSAAGSIKGAATSLDEKSFEDLYADAEKFVREKPAMAVGMAAAAGFVLSRLFRGK